MDIPRGFNGKDVMAEGAVRLWGAALEHRGPLLKEHTAHRVRKRQSVAAVGESKGCARMVKLRANDTAFDEKSKAVRIRRKAERTAKGQANCGFELGPVLLRWWRPQRPAVRDDRDDRCEDKLANQTRRRTSGGDNAGNRVEDLEEVCAQAIKSCVWLLPDQFLDRLRYRRTLASILGYQKGTEADAVRILTERPQQIQFRVHIVQPGVVREGRTDAISNLLAAARNYLIGSVNEFRVLGSEQAG